MTSVIIQYIGLWLLILLALNIWAFLSVVKSGRGVLRIALWGAVLLTLPGIGFVAWYLIGPREART